ncbi:cytochrome P450 307a1-like [Chrysoperla carnea]|uniref:cytochrome P450 307a1-like n=1 Tax=Chrysoperla carnea TaxID=189513 RepID=UPI001D079EBA|nr:cytochrome P450 307a1-like [Chrysoperla carnea]
MDSVRAYRKIRRKLRHQYFINYETTSNNNKSVGDENNDLPLAPGPKSYPIIGSMHLLGQYEVPYQAFGELAKTYGPIIKMDLGSVPSLIVNGHENIREILFTKGTHFDSRPNFKRYHHLFSGDKENSLAFCNWSNLQKSRREMLRPHTFPTSFSRRFQELDQIILNEIPELINHFQPNTNGENVVNLKEVVLKSCANIFMDYFCTKKFTWSSPEFERMIHNYDEVFYEVNQGYAADFLPFLLPLHTQNFAKMAKCTHSIREFVMENIIEERFNEYDEHTTGIDYVDALIESVKLNNSNNMDWETALFALEDIIGGHSAVGNFLIKVLTFLVQNPDAQAKMQQEIDECLRNKLNDTYIPNRTPEVDIFRSEHELDAYVQTDMEKLELETRNETTDVNNLKQTTCCDKQRETDLCNDRISIKDRNSMPYTEAVILEGIRLIASPIVPHVANQDSSVGGYKVPKDTLIFLNNYELNMSEKLWDEPNAFKPERFIKNGKVQKPDYFLPFGGGKRSCMGYKMVQLIGFSILSNIIQSYTLKPYHTVPKVPIGNLALKPSIEINFTFEKRRTQN